MVIPKRNLAPDQEPWGRSVDDAIKQLSLDSENNARKNENSFKSINSSMTAMNKQVVNLAMLIASQVSADGQSVGLLVDSISTGWDDEATTTISVPVWAVHAVVTTIGTVSVQDTVSGGSAFCEARMQIAGTAGQSILLPVTAGASVYLSTGTVAFTKVITGFGATINCGLQLKASRGDAYTAGGATTATTIIFTR